MLKIMLRAMPVVLLAGCGAFPSQVRNPSTTAMNDPAKFLATGDDGGPAVPSVKDGLLAAKQAEVFARTWRTAGQELLLARDTLNNAQFGLVVAGVYNTVRNAMPAGKWALAGAGGVAVVADRYQIEAQATAYRQGAEVMECVRYALEMVPTTVWRQYDANGMLQMNVSGLQGAGIEKAQEAYDSLTTLLPAVYNTMSSVSNRVFDNVSSKTLRVPKGDDIVKAVQDQQMAAKEADDKAKALYRASRSGANTPADDAELQQLQHDLETVKDQERRVSSLQSQSRERVLPGDADVSALSRLQADTSSRKALIQRRIAAIQGQGALVAAKAGEAFPSKPAIEMALKLPATLKTCEAHLGK